MQDVPRSRTDLLCLDFYCSETEAAEKEKVDIFY
jgi:hypothetical protein